MERTSMTTNKIRLGILGLFVCAFIAVTQTANAGTLVYRLDTNSLSSPPALHEYDATTNTWAVRAAVPAGNATQLTSDGTTLYSLNGDGNIYSYNRGADSWSFVQAGPAASVGSGVISMFETHNGEFYWGDDGSNTLHYTSAGAWNSIATPRTISSGSGIDRSTGEIYIRTFFELGGSVFDTGSNSFTTIFDNATVVGENSRVGEFYNGSFYSRSSTGNLIAVNPTTAVGTDTGVPLITSHASTAVTPNGLIYLNGYGGTQTLFEVFDINTSIRTTLASSPLYGGNAHPSLAVITTEDVAVPEPGSLALLSLGTLVLVGGYRLKRRKR